MQKNKYNKELGFVKTLLLLARSVFFILKLSQDTPIDRICSKQ